MAERHWSTDTLIARTDVALSLNSERTQSSATQARFRLDFLNIVSAVDFQTMKSEQALPLLVDLLEKIRSHEATGSLGG